MAGMLIAAAARTAAVLAAPIAGVIPALAAEPVMVQCGREYQVAKSAGTLNGADWGAYRVACAERLKAGTAASAVPSPVRAAASPPPTSTPPPASAAAPAPPTMPVLSSTVPNAGAAAMHARQKQCGAEWTATKATLVAATPGLTWPKYWSQCNARLKAAPGAAVGGTASAPGL